jgi:ABC-type polysaccharide/polyol phosphate export permease
MYRKFTGLAELFSGIRDKNYWFTLSVADIRRKYVRTILGPFWSVLNSIIFVLIIGICYSSIFSVQVSKLLPHFSAGYFCWLFISTTISESYGVIHANGIVIKTSRIRPISFILRLISRNFLVFLHNIVISFVIAVIYGINLRYAPLSLLGLASLLLFIFPVSVLVSFACCRFRDLEPMIANTLLIVLFVTPLLWFPEMLSADKRFLVDFNPVYHLIELIRAPLLGSIPSLWSYMFTFFMIAVLNAAAVLIYVKLRRRLAYWI